MEKNPEPGSGMSMPDLILENLVSVFRVKILKFCVRIRDKHPGFATLPEMDQDQGTRINPNPDSKH
jgi:hypothetical protein